MQCYLTEHLCFSPNTPLPETFCDEVNGDNASPGGSISPYRLVETKVGSEFIVVPPTRLLSY